MPRHEQNHRRPLIAVLALTAALAGCWSGSAPPEGQGDTASGASAGNPGEAHVSDITLGRSLGPDGTIAEDSRTNSYWTTDKFYVEVKTDGSVPGATVKARWTYSDGAVVGEDTKTVDASAAPLLLQATAQSPDGRWKAGDYKLEIIVNNVSAGTRDLTTR